MFSVVTCCVGDQPENPTNSENLIKEDLFSSEVAPQGMRTADEEVDRLRSDWKVREI